MHDSKGIQIQSVSRGRVADEGSELCVKCDVTSNYGGRNSSNYGGRKRIFLETSLRYDVPQEHRTNNLISSLFFYSSFKKF